MTALHLPNCISDVKLVLFHGAQAAQQSIDGKPMLSSCSLADMGKEGKGCTVIFGITGSCKNKINLR